MSPYRVPEGSPLRVDAGGKASCAELNARLPQMSEEQQLAHLIAHYESCDDPPEMYEICPFCRPLRRAYEAQVNAGAS